MELVNRVVPPKPTDEEIKAGKPKREAYRKSLLQTQATLSKLEEEVSSPLGISSEQKALQSEVDKALAWVNANIEVSPNEVDVKQTAFNETFQTLVLRYNQAAEKAFTKDPKQEIVNAYPFPDGKKALQQIVNQSNQKDKRKQQQEKVDLQNRTYWDDFKEALSSVVKWGLLVFVLFYALRAASFAANQNLFLPLPYRALKFIYTFIFFPIWIPYYLYREVKHLIWPCIDEPHFESVFPVQPYNPQDGIDLNKRLFGYPNVPELCNWIQKKKDEWKEQRLEVLKGDFMSKLLSEEKEA
jgi:hypothetical protein